MTTIDTRTVATWLRVAGWLVLAVGLLSVLAVYLDLTDVAENPAPAMFVIQAGVPVLGVWGLLVGLAEVIDLLRDRD